MGDVALVMQYVDAIGLHDEARGSTLAEGVELVGRRGDAGLKEAMMDAVLSDIARMPEPARAQALARVGRALLGLGEAERAAKLFDEALAVADGISRPKSDQGWTRNNCLQTLGHMWAEADVWSHGLQALKKCTSKHFKPGIATRLSYSYARQGDLAGARVLLSHVPGNHIKSVMSACDCFICSRACPHRIRVIVELERWAIDTPRRECVVCSPGMQGRRHRLIPTTYLRRHGYALGRRRSSDYGLRPRR